jgi:prophage antirepressor-like protein
MNLSVFGNQEFGGIRVVKIGGNPYVVGSDAARALGYEKPRKAVGDICARAAKHRVFTNGGEQETRVIPASDIRRLIAESADKARAERFGRWIFGILDKKKYIDIEFSVNTENTCSENDPQHNGGEKMKKGMQLFSHKEFGEIRFVELDRKPHAVGVDVARALEYAKPSQAVIDHCRGIRKLGIPHQQTNQHGLSGETTQETNVIPEGDIYRLIIKAADQSRNPEIKAKAEKFERWVFDELLPSIRQNGCYGIPKAKQAQRVPENLVVREQLEIAKAFSREAGVPLDVDKLIDAVEERTGQDYTRWRDYMSEHTAPKTAGRKYSGEQDEWEPAVMSWLALPLPKDWDKRGFAERRLFWSSGEEGTEPRKMACPLEVWCECFGKSKGSFNSGVGRRIAAILNKLDGWERKQIVRANMPYSGSRFYVSPALPYSITR